MNGITGATLNQWVLSSRKREPEQPKTLAEQLRQEAAKERRIARQYEGCSWLGDCHPSTPHYNRASVMEQAAAIVAAEESRRAKRKKNK